MISVIIPVFQSEKTIDILLQSLVSQSYTNWEAILIDDGSTDYSFSLCKKWASKDPRIKVYHQNNKGVSSARNVGLEKSSGEWITFVDSDDYLDVDYLASFYNALCGEDVFYCLNGIRIVNELGKEIKSEIITKEEIDSTFTDTDRYVLLYQHYSILASGCLKLFNKHIIETPKIRFDERISYGEDRKFVADYLLSSRINRIKLIDYVGYNYVQHPGSLTKQKYSAKEWMYTTDCWYRGLMEINSKFQVTNDRLIKKQLTFIKTMYIDAVFYLFSSSDEKSILSCFQLYSAIRHRLKSILNTCSREGYQKYQRIIEKRTRIGGFLFFYGLKVKRKLSKNNRDDS